MAQVLCKQESNIHMLFMAIIFTNLLADFTWAQVWRAAGVSLPLPCKAPWPSPCCLPSCSFTLNLPVDPAARSAWILVNLPHCLERTSTYWVTTVCEGPALIEWLLYGRCSLYISWWAQKCSVSSPWLNPLGTQYLRSPHALSQDLGVVLYPFAPHLLFIS